MQPWRIAGGVAMSTRLVITGTPTPRATSTRSATSEGRTVKIVDHEVETTSMSRLRSGNVPSRCNSMNRAIGDQRPRAARRVECSVCPTAEDETGVRGGLDSSRGSARRKGEGFSPGRGTRDFKKMRSAISLCSSVGTAMVTASTWRAASRGRRPRASRWPPRPSRRAAGWWPPLHQLDPRQRRRIPRVCFPRCPTRSPRRADSWRHRPTKPRKSTKNQELTTKTEKDQTSYGFRVFVLS